MHSDLFPFQRDAATWLASHQSLNLLLGDAMGVGKTASSIAGADLVGAKSILVVCPGIARVNWQREVHRWQTVNRSVGVMFGSKDKASTDVVITSYSLLPQRAALQKLLARDWDLVIADESHLIKSREAKRTRCLLGNRCNGQAGLVSKAKRFWCLTGTPIPNNLAEFWTVAHGLFQGSTEGLERYTLWKDYFTTSRDTEFGNVIVGSRNHGDFIRRVKPFVLRRTMQQVLPNMPALRITDVVLTPDRLPPRSAELDEVDRVIKGALAKAGKGDSDEAKAAMSSLKEMHIASLRKWTGEAKAEAVAAQINQDFAGGMDKVVIFAVHRTVIETLSANIPGSLVIDGRTPVHRRQEIIDKFQNSGLNARVVIVQIEIGSTALTLTASCNVVFAETSYVPKDIWQAVCRCHRLGQKRPVLARIFSLRGSSDEQVSATLARKTRDISTIEQGLAA